MDRNNIYAFFDRATSRDLPGFEAPNHVSALRMFRATLKNEPALSENAEFYELRHIGVHDLAESATYRLPSGPETLCTATEMLLDDEAVFRRQQADLPNLRGAGSAVSGPPIDDVLSSTDETGRVPNGVV